VPIVHRDVSPKNVMVTYEGDVKVIDFGIAKARGSLQQTQAGTVKGTTPYMSPEQLLGEPVDGRSDLFAAGAMFHELLTGVRLFAADDESKIIRMIVRDPIVSPITSNPAVPKQLEAVVMKSLERDLNARFQTGKEMARAIEHALGPALAEEETAGTFMRSLFVQKLARTRALLALSVAPDEAKLQLAADTLGGEEQLESGSKLRKRSRIMRQDPDEVPTHTLASKLPETPRPSPSASRRVAEPPPSAPTPPVNTVPTVMVVDDSAVGINFVKMALADLGCKVVGCSKPVLALNVFEAEQPDLVILDVVMPEIDGFEVCRLIREKNPHRYLPILFVSAACSLEERVKGLTVGGDDFIRKPCDREELAARVRIHLQRAASLKLAKA
jgi:CheY-like chemotaxis protein